VAEYLHDVEYVFGSMLFHGCSPVSKTQPFVE
jgi:hypothetical protein